VSHTVALAVQQQLHNRTNCGRAASHARRTVVRHEVNLVHDQRIGPRPAHGDGAVAYDHFADGQKILAGPAVPIVDRVVDDLAAHRQPIQVPPVVNPFESGRERGDGSASVPCVGRRFTHGFV